MTTWDADAVAGLYDRVADQLPDAVELRHRLHAEPRVSGDEDATLRTLLQALGADVAPLDHGGAIVRIGEAAGPAVAVRAEMDALPVVERSDVDWRSTNNAMHACGHDVHMAGATALALALQDHGGPLPLVLLLQPREETYPSGGRDLSRSPALRDHDVRAVLGVHVQPRLPAGQFSAVPGPVNAASDQFSIVVSGRPGHAAYPHLTADPVVASADLIGTVQHLISRQVDPTNPTVLTVGSIEGGNSPNVVPAAVTMKGTLRTFDEADRQHLHSSLQATAEAVATVHGCEAVVDITRGAPVLDNDRDLAVNALTWIEATGMRPSPPLRSCGADDFSFYCDLFPSLMVFVGVGPGGPGQPGLHNPAFLPPDEAVGDVARALVSSYLAACSMVVDLPTPTPPTARWDQDR